MRASFENRKGQARLPALWLFTDPVRTPDIGAVMRRLPPGSGVVYRPFGAPHALEEGERLTRLARDLGHVMLAGRDEDLALAIGADGVHLPQSRLCLGRALRPRRPGFILTGAAHSRAALAQAADQGLDLAFLSAVFSSNSPSAGRPLGPQRFTRLVRAARLPVVALGGVTPERARRLRASGAYGLAAVEALVDPVRADEIRT